MNNFQVKTSRKFVLRKIRDNLVGLANKERIFLKKLGTQTGTGNKITASGEKKTTRNFIARAL